MMGIYQIKSLKTNKVYVGLSVDIERRWEGHRQQFVDGTHGGYDMLMEFRRYGMDNFVFTVLEETDLLYHREHYWQDHLKSYDPTFGFNSLAEHEMLRCKAQYKPKKFAEPKQPQTGDLEYLNGRVVAYIDQGGNRVVNQ